MRNDCQIYDINIDKWIKSIKLNHDDQMPGVALFLNRFVYVFHNNPGLVEYLDLSNLDNGFQKIETSDNGFKKSYYCEAIQIDSKHILVFGGYPENNQSYKFHVDSKTFIKTKTQLPIVANAFWNNSQPLIFDGKVFVIDCKRRVICYEILTEEWKIVVEL